MKKKAVILAVKLVVGALLIAYVVYKIAPSWSELKGVLYAFFEQSSQYLVFATLCFGTVLLLGTLRWRMLLAAHQVKLAFVDTLKLTLVGHFFSQFMPGGIAGGDIIKSFYIANTTDTRKHEAVATIFIDRMVGIFGLFGVLAAGVIVNLGVSGEKVYVIFVLCFLFGSAVLMLLLFSKSLLKKVPGFNTLHRMAPYRDFLTRVYNAFNYYKDHRTVLVATLLISTAIHAVLVVMVCFLVRGFGLDVPVKRFFILVPIVNFFGSVPVSPMGTIGILEAAYIRLFGGTTTEDSALAGALALLVRLVYAIWGLVGLLVWLFMRSRIKLTKGENEDTLSAGNLDTNGVIE